ncbi:MAG: ABC transporter permease [Candidatus Odinarchaeota archaeon]
MSTIQDLLVTARQRKNSVIGIIGAILFMIMTLVLDNNLQVLWEIFEPQYLSSLMGHSIAFFVPIFLAALGGLYSERSGVINLALEGMMLSGAFTGVIFSYLTNNFLVGVIAGICIGSVLGLVHAFICIKLRGDQIISGVAINILALGVTNFASKVMIADVPPQLISGVPKITQILGLKDFFGHAPSYFIIWQTIFAGLLAGAVTFIILWRFREKSIGYHREITLLIVIVLVVYALGRLINEALYIDIELLAVIAGLLAGAISLTILWRHQEKLSFRRITMISTLLALLTFLISLLTLFLTTPNMNIVDELSKGLLGTTKLIGYVFLEQSPIVYTALILGVLGHLVLYRTVFGLRVRAVGEHPRAADTVGINVYLVRYACTIFSGAMAGLAGVYLSMGFLSGTFAKGMSSGRGFIAIAAYVFGNWNVVGAAVAAGLFGFFSAIQEFLRVSQVILIIPVPIPGIGWAEINILSSDFLDMIPYLLTVIVLAGSVKRVRAPSAIGKPYKKE